MSPFPGLASQKSRLGVLLDHSAAIDDPRDVRRIAHPLAEVLLLVVCATMADCDDYDHAASCSARKPCPTRPARSPPSQSCWPAWLNKTGCAARSSPSTPSQPTPPSPPPSDAGADYLLAVKANQPTLRAEVEACFAAARPGTVATRTEHDKGHGRIEQRTTSLLREVDWLSGDRRFPGELRLPGVACIIRVAARVERGGTVHIETRYYVSSADLDAERAGQAVRGHWAIENSLHWVLDVTFGDDQSRLRKEFRAKNMAVVRHFALNLVRAAKDKHSIRLRRKLATWTPTYLEQLLNADAK